MKELKILSTIESETNSKTISIDYQEDASDGKSALESRSSNDNFFRRFSAIVFNSSEKKAILDSDSDPCDAKEKKSRAVIAQCLSQDEISASLKSKNKFKHMHSTTCALQTSDCPLCINERNFSFQKRTLISCDAEKLRGNIETTSVTKLEKNTALTPWMMKREQFADAVKKKSAMWKTLNCDPLGEQTRSKEVDGHHCNKQKQKQVKEATKQIEIIIEHATTLDESSEGPDLLVNKQKEKLTNLKIHVQEERKNVLKCTKNGPHFFHVKKIAKCTGATHDHKLFKQTGEVMSSSKNETSLLNTSDFSKCKTDNEYNKDLSNLQTENLMPTVSCNSRSLKNCQNSSPKVSNTLLEGSATGQETKADDRRMSVASSHIYRYTTDECLSRHGSLSCVSFADDFRRSRVSSTATNFSEVPKATKRFSFRRKQNSPRAYSSSGHYKSCVSLSANSNCSSESTHSKRRREIERHIAYSAFLISIAFSLLVLPTFVLEFINNFTQLSTELHLVAAILTWFRVVINPYLYGYLNPQYRLHCKHMWCNANS